VNHAVLFLIPSIFLKLFSGVYVLFGSEILLDYCSLMINKNSEAAKTGGRGKKYKE